MLDKELSRFQQIEAVLSIHTMLVFPFCHHMTDLSFKPGLWVCGCMPSALYCFGVLLCLILIKELNLCFRTLTYMCRCTCAKHHTQFSSKWFHWWIYQTFKKVVNSSGNWRGGNMSQSFHYASITMIQTKDIMKKKKIIDQYPS